MEISEHWKLCTDFSIVQAALLIAGYDPEDFDRLYEHDIKARAPGYTAARTALYNAVRARNLATSHTGYERDENGNEQRGLIDPYSTTISAVDLERSRLRLVHIRRP
jgi:hypothetical protein